MYREFGEKLKIVSNSYVRVYVSGSFDRHWYPYKLRPAHNASTRQRDETMEMILDSSITKPDITNQDVIEKAEELNPHYVIPKDKLEDQVDGDLHLAVTESIAHFLDLWEDSETRARPLIPLQPPYEDHYQMVVDRLGYEPSHICLGGMKDDPTHTQIQAAKQFFRSVDGDPYIHMLGVGASLEFIRTVQLDKEFRRMVDSIDLATTEHMTKSVNFSAGRAWKQKPGKLANGKNRSTLTAAFSDSYLLHLNFMLGSFCWDELIQPDPDPDELRDHEIEALEKVVYNPFIPDDTESGTVAADGGEETEQQQIIQDLDRYYDDE